MRFAVIGTPRSGNSLLRRVLSQAYGLQEAASHDPDFLLGDLPDDTVFQVHARHTPRIEESLRRQQVTIVTPQRHPIDTLLSMLHFAQFEPEVDRWLGGAYLSELPGCDPTSRAFREFALGDGAADLLSVSVEWRPHADADVLYWQLAEDPLSILGHEGLGPHRIVGAEAQVRAASSFEHFHSAHNMHGWLGRAGYWRDFVCTDLAEAIVARHPAPFESGGFGVEGSCDLTPQAIRVAWAQAFTGIADEREAGQSAAASAARRPRRWARLLSGAGAAGVLSLAAAPDAVPLVPLAAGLG